ncbi:hypothetical protein CGCSCA1_v000210 [Colletotrichum siamense]|nr:hypothetical protein CGCSCA1_v000210 [Colletotrichum siamense]
MADPFSIVTGCVGLIGAAGATVNAITAFVRDCRAARGDLTIVARELTDLQLILELLKDDGEGHALPNSLQDQIDRIVERCKCIIKDIEDVLKRCKGSSRAIIWAASEKKEVESLRRDLEIYRESLGLTVETTTLWIARSIKADTGVIRQQTQIVPEIKNDTERILEEIKGLRTSHQPEDGTTESTTGFIEDYLDGLTTYAETVCEDVVWDSESEDEDQNESDVIDESRNTAPMTVETHDIDVEEREICPQSTPLECKCHNCASTVNAKESRRNPCGHWLCDKCINIRFKESTRHPFPTPKCCGWRLSLKQAEPTFDDKLKNSFNHFWERLYEFDADGDREKVLK